MTLTRSAYVQVRCAVVALWSERHQPYAARTRLGTSNLTQNSGFAGCSLLEGEVEYRLGESWAVALAGSTICVPSGVVHAFRNSSTRLARHLVVHAPVAALALIEEVGRTPQEQWAPLFERYKSRLIKD